MFTISLDFVNIYVSTMENKCTPWILCPSKKFPGHFYYFNTKTGEKAWTSTSEETPDGDRTATMHTTTAEVHTSFGRVQFSNYLQNSPINTRKKCIINLNKPNVNGPSVRDSQQLFQILPNITSVIAAAKFKPAQLPTNPFLVTEASKIKDTTKRMVFDPMFNLTLTLKRRASTDIEDVTQAMKKCKITSNSPSNEEQSRIHIESDDDTLSKTQNRWVYNENVKVCINFLRNLSKSEYTEAWYLVPDVDVLLDNLNYIKTFIAGDGTCSLMIPAAVLAKVRSLRDDHRVAKNRASVAGRVFQWLHKNAVCQPDSIDDSSVDDVSINEEIIEYCKEVSVFHLVIITKSKKLLDHARKDNIHAYHIDALKIIKPTENLFLQDPSNTKIFKWPATTPARENGRVRKNSECKNIKITVNENGVRSSINHTSDKRELTSNIFEGHTTKLDHEIEDKLKEFCVKHAYLQTNVNKRVEEWTCSYLQIMEDCLHNILQNVPHTQFDPPYWLHQGLQLLKDHYSRNKTLCAIAQRLILMCEQCTNSNGIKRPKIKSDQFIKVLGAGVLLIEQLKKVSEFPSLSDSKKMLFDLLASIQTAGELSELASTTLECRQLPGDEPLRIENRSMDYNFVSDIERASEPQYEQDKSEDFDKQCNGSVPLFREDILNGSISKPNRFDSNQDKTIDDTTSSNRSNSIKSGTKSSISQENDTVCAVFQKCKYTVDKIKYSLTRMKLFIENRIQELSNDRITGERKQYLRKKSNRFIENTAGMIRLLKVIIKREDPNDPDFRTEFAVQEPAYTNCIKHCLEQAEIIHTSFIYLLDALK